ncbi:MAG: hypothetical protein GEV04_03910 [Actinophytocola sp.]|nr:hypothetical protein [Actinophytocola sp.]
MRIKTRGPVITQGVDRPTVRLTVDDNGKVRRTKVYANRDYETRPSNANPARREWIIPSSVSHPPVASLNTRRQGLPQLDAPKKPRRRKARPAALSGRATGPTAIRRTPGSAARPHDIVIAPVDNQYCEEACYWLPPTTEHVTASQYAILDALSQLLWVDVPAAQWRDGELVEHDAPIGLTSTELAAEVHHVEQPTPRQMRSVEHTIKHLIQRRLVERTSTRRYRLRGWQCLHTRRRTTRRAIEIGGGRAVYQYVRHSA